MKKSENDNQGDGLNGSTVVKSHILWSRLGCIMVSIVGVAFLGIFSLGLGSITFPFATYLKPDTFSVLFLLLYWPPPECLYS